MSLITTRPDGQREYRISDHLGSSRVVLNDAGIVASTVDYAAFGGTVAVTGADVRKNFIDKELDGESATYNTGVRQYEPETGFTSIDPMWEKYPGWTPYHYCFHNPLGAKDPSGMDTSVGKAIIDGLGDAITNIVATVVESCPAVSSYRMINGEKPNLPTVEGLQGLWNTATGENGTYSQVRLLVGLGTETAFWAAATGGMGAAGGAGRGATQVGKAAEQVVQKARPSAFAPLEGKSLLSKAKVKELTKEIAANDTQNIKPVEVFEHQGIRYVLDAHHRVAAARAAKIEVPYISIPLNAQNKYKSLDAILRAASEAGGR